MGDLTKALFTVALGDALSDEVDTEAELIRVLFGIGREPVAMA